MKPYLSMKHKWDRKMWARKHAKWTEEKWKKVWFSDESKFNLFGSNGCLYCRRAVGEEFLDRNVRKEMKHGGGSVMVWGCLTWNGTGRLCPVKGRMDARQYCKILKEGLLETIADKKTGMGAIIF